MFKKFAIKNDYLVIAGILFLLVVGYQLAFRKTLDAWQLHNRLNKQLQATDLGYQPAYEERKNHNLDKLLATFKTDTTNLRNNIIITIAGIAEKEHVKLTEAPTQDPFYHTDKMIIQRFSFAGDYFSLLKTLNHLQSEMGIGLVRSTIIKSTVNHGGQKETKQISLMVYFETLR